MKKLLGKLATLSFSHARYVFLIVAAVTLVAAYYVSRIQISTNNFDLLPQDSKMIKEFWEVNEDFGAQDRHLMLIEIPDSVEPDPSILKDFVHRLDETLSKSGLVSSINYAITPDQKNFIDEFFVRNALLYLSSSDLDSVLRRFEDPEIARRILNCKNILNMPVPPDPSLKKVLREDPLLLSEIFVPYIERMLGKQNASLLKDEESYYLSKDKRTLLVFIKPVGASNDTRFCETFVDRNIEIRDSIVAAMGEDGAKLHIMMGGNYVSALTNARAVKQGLVDSSVFVISCILVFFYFFYGDIRSLVFIVVPVFIGVIWVFCIGELAFVKFNIITASAGAMLLGLGVDYAIHIYNRFVTQEQHFKHHTTLQNLVITFQETGLSVFYGVVSTAFVFAVLMVTRFRGLYELGFIGGLGIFVLFVAVVVLMPAEITMRPRRSVKRNYLQTMVSKVLDYNSRFVLRHPKYITTGCLIISAFMIAVLLNYVPSKDEGIGVTFDDNIENIRSKNDVDLQMIKRMQEKFGSHFKPVSVVCEATTNDMLVEKLRLLNIKMDTLVERGMVKEYNSLLRYVPSLEQQHKNLKKIRALDVESILFQIRLEMTKVGLRMNYFKLNRLREMMSVREPITLEHFQKEGFGDIMRHYYVEKNGLKKVVTQVELAGASYEIDIVNAFIQEVDQDKQLGGDYIITGIRVVTAEFLTLVKEDFAVALIASLLTVIVLVTLKYRSFRAVLLCTVPLTFSILCIMGVMRLYGIKINFVNMIAVPLLIGSGVDYGIYIISRYLEDQRHDVFAAIHETGQSLFLSGLTTVIGFGSLVLVDNRGLASMGYMCGVGIIICALSSIIVLPAMLRLWGKKIWKIESSEPRKTRSIE